MKYKILALLCIAFFFWLVIQPVELYWSYADMLLMQGVGGVAVIAALILVWRKQQLILSTIDAVVVLWFVYVMLRIYVDPIYPNAYFCLRVLQMVALYGGIRLLLSSVQLSERVIVLILLLCGIYEVYLGVEQLINGGSRHHIFLLTGSFLNPGPYSVFLGMGLVMSCLLEKNCSSSNNNLKTLFKWLPWVFLILLPATWSRATIISAVICLVIIYWNQLKRWRWWLGGVFFLVLTGLYFLKQGSADGRSIIYIISLLSICHAPVFGSGIGSFCHQYAEEIARFSSQHPEFDYQSADVIEGAFNSILQIGVEQGLVGVCLAVSLVVLVLARLYRSSKAMGIGLLCLLIFSMFSYPFDQLPYQIIFVFIAAYAATDQKENALSTKMSQLSKRYILPTIMLGCVVSFSLFTHNQIMERARAEYDYHIMSGLKNSDFIYDYYELLPLLSYNKHFLFDLSKMLIVDGRYNDSNAILRLGTLISNDPMFYVIQGNNYLQMGFYHEAEAVYQKAFDIMPNRLYPLYQLMLLYGKEGNKREQLKMAQQVLNFNEKVISPATIEMKEKAKEVSESLIMKKEVAENL